MCAVLTHLMQVSVRRGKAVYVCPCIKVGRTSLRMVCSAGSCSRADFLRRAPHTHEGDAQLPELRTLRGLILGHLNPSA